MQLLEIKCHSSSVLFQTQVEAIDTGNVPDMSQSVIGNVEGQH